MARLRREDVAAALSRRMSREDQVITLVATADTLLPALAPLAGDTPIEVVPFDEI